MQELLHNFGVDWKLLLAQVVNFAILFYVLKRFAYVPIVDMLAERKERIKKGLSDAALSEEKLKQTELVQKEVLDAAQKKALTLVQHAEDKALEKEALIIESGHRKAESILQSGARVIEEEKSKMKDEVYRDAVSLVERATAKVLGKMEPAERDRILVEEALRELKVVGKK